MRLASIPRAALLIGLSCLLAASFLHSEVRFSWIIPLALGCSLVGGALAWFGRGPTRLVALTTLVLGWYLRIHAGGDFDGLPIEPVIARWFDLSPLLGCALGAAGLLTTHRRLLGIGGVLLLAAGLYPLGIAGGTSIPLLTALSTPGWPLVLLLLTTLLGGGLVWSALNPGRVAALGWRGSVVCLVVIPAWLLVSRQALPSALFAVGDLLAITGGAALLSSEKHDARMTATAELLTVVLAATFWWLLKIHGLGYAGMDEYIYFYASNAWTKGVWPYRDFFFAHPPVHVAVPALVFAVAGFQHLLAKLIAPVTIFIAGLVLWRSARKHFGPFAGAVTLLLFWFANEIMVASTTLTGVELTTLFLVLGITAALDRRSFIAGLWFGVAVCTGVYGAAGFLTFVVLALLAPVRPDGNRLPGSRLDAARMAAGFFVVFATINLVFYAIGGARYLDGVYRYHFLKAVKNPDQYAIGSNPLAPLLNLAVLLQGRDFRVALNMQPFQFWLVVLGPLILLVRRASTGQWMIPPPKRWWAEKPGGTNPDGAVILLWLSFAGTLAELGSLSERFPYYFALVFPTAALIGGFAVGEIARLCDAALTTPAPAPPAKKGKTQTETALRPSWMWAAGALVLLTVWVPIDAWANASLYPEEVEPGSVGQIVRFEWTPSPVLPALGEMAHALVWTDFRRRGDLVSTARFFLRTKKRTFEQAPAIAAYVDDHTTPEDTIFGASDYTPLIALLSHRRLAGNWVDTNSKVFSTGIVQEDEFWADVCRDRPAYLVATEASHFSPGTFGNRPRISDFFHHEVTFEDHGLKFGRAFNIELWRRSHDPPETICPP